MKLSLEIRSTQSVTPGTVGWLVANAGHVKIGTTKEGRQGAWLMDREGQRLTVLAIRNYAESYEEATERPDNPTGEVTRAQERPDSVHEYDETLYLDRHFSSAALKIIRDVQKAAVAEMDRLNEDIDPELVVVEVRRVEDRTARQIAADALRDPKALAILHDRLTESQP